jgi:6-phosphogluconate dehydrogenase (decarboxylating)
MNLMILASSQATEIWLADDEGSLVQKAVGKLETDLLPGDYVVEFGLGATTYPVALRRSRTFTQRQLEGGPTCPRPVFKLKSCP